MTIYASYNSNRYVTGFYSDGEGFHTVDQIPTPNVAITDAVHQALLAGQAQGKLMALDANNNALLIDRSTLVTLADAQATVKTAIKAYRDDLLLLTPFQGKSFQTDLASKMQISTIADSGVVPAYATQWRTADNTYLPMTIDLFIQLKATIMAREGAAYVNSAKLQDQVGNLTKVSDVQSFDFSGGWPV